MQVFFLQRMSTDIGPNFCFCSCFATKKAKTKKVGPCNSRLKYSAGILFPIRQNSGRLYHGFWHSNRPMQFGLMPVCWNGDYYALLAKRTGREGCQRAWSTYREQPIQNWKCALSCGMYRVVEKYMGMGNLHKIMSGSQTLRKNWCQYSTHFKRYTSIIIAPCCGSVIKYKEYWTSL